MRAGTERGNAPPPAMDTGGFFTVSGVAKSFGGLRALDDVSLDVDEGKIVCVIGPNGSGKTTLFNIISGLLDADHGSITFRGAELMGRPPHEIARRRLARTFQHARLFANLNLLQNVELPQYAGSHVSYFHTIFFGARERRERKAVREEAERLLAEVAGGRLYPRRFDYPHTCSLGEQRILEIIRVLAMKPAMILMDEPTQGLNPAWVAEILDLIEEIRRRKVTILFIEHKMSVVMKISDRVVVLNSGRKIAEGGPEQVRRNPAVIQAYLGD